MIICHMQLHGGAQKTLQQGVMQFLRDACALGESFFKAHTHLLRQAQQPEPEKQQDYKSDEQHTRKPEPPCLPERRSDFKGKGSLGTIPCPFAVACHNPESIRAWAEIRIDRFACRGGLTPGRIKALEHILEP